MEKVIYKEIQYGWEFIVVLIAIYGLVFCSYMVEWGSNPVSSFALIYIFTPVFALALLLVYRMKTVVTEENLSITMGILFYKKFRIKEIKKSVVVHNSWMMGWGIRWVVSGWLYNIRGLKAVELHYKNKKRMDRIGSSNPDKLKAVIDDLIEVNR